MNEKAENNENVGFSGTVFFAKIFGFLGLFLSNNPTLLDRWRWLKKRLPTAHFKEKLIDVGCGSGTITTGAARLGYDALGLSWDDRSLKIAKQCAQYSKADSARFEVMDLRKLNEREDLTGAFDIAVCFEAVEHIIDDKKLLIDIATLLKPGGRLLLTTPYYNRSLIQKKVKPFAQLEVEDGDHVLLGYTTAMLVELCDHAELVVEHESYCTGFVSQKITYLMYLFQKIHPRLGSIVLFPLWLLPPIFDHFIARITGYPYYSICIEAFKPRYNKSQ